MFLSRLAVVATTAVTLVVASAGLASAHVTVSSPDAGSGGYGKVTFRVPTESDTLSTVKIRIQLPTKTPLASVSTMPVPGWTATMTKAPLNPPIKDDDGNTVSEAVSVVEFDAAPGAGIGPGQFQEFSLSGGPFPKSSSLTFPVVQTYSDGSEVAWIEPTVEGQPEPGHPAPVLSLSGGSTKSDAATPTTGAATATHDHSSQLAGSPAGVTLFLAILALVVGAAGVVLGLRASRRTVGS
ncbi:MAG TPA: YcnI family protein [Blastococcus sp.]|nr:YcnI family protein [Blastococcus sp.]